MAKFVYLFVGGNVPEDLREQNMKDWGDWFAEVSKSGKVRGGEPFGAHNRVLSADGSAPRDFDWGKDSGTSGYMIVETDDLDEAVALTEGCPQLDKRYGDGTVEVREAQAM